LPQKAHKAGKKTERVPEQGATPKCIGTSGENGETKGVDAIETTDGQEVSHEELREHEESRCTSGHEIDESHEKGLREQGNRRAGEQETE
jgi:hypothetical protein